MKKPYNREYLLASAKAAQSCIDDARTLLDDMDEDFVSTTKGNTHLIPTLLGDLFTQRVRIGWVIDYLEGKR